MTVGKKLDFAALYRILQAPVTEFDCGTLCAPGNGGIPVCCESSEVIPVLYKPELKMLMERTELWRPWRPRTVHDRRLKDEMSHYTLAVCKGASHCERDNRSLNCRTFPFMPYFTHAGDLAGLVYDYESAEGKCPLVERPELITARYIRESLEYWQTLVETEAHESDFYRAESDRARRRFARRRQPVPVLVLEGIRHYPTAKSVHDALQRDGSLPRLTPLVRPAG